MSESARGENVRLDWTVGETEERSSGDSASERDKLAHDYSDDD